MKLQQQKNREELWIMCVLNQPMHYSDAFDILLKRLAIKATTVLIQLFERMSPKWFFACLLGLFLWFFVFLCTFENNSRPSLSLSPPHSKTLIPSRENKLHTRICVCCVCHCNGCSGAYLYSFRDYICDHIALAWLVRWFQKKKNEKRMFQVEKWIIVPVNTLCISYTCILSWTLIKCTKDRHFRMGKTIVKKLLLFFFKLIISIEITSLWKPFENCQ